MVGSNNHFDEYKEVLPSRLDLKSRLCLMAAFIFGAAYPEITPEDAIEKAVEIENATDAQVRKMKRENPIPRKGIRR